MTESEHVDRILSNNAIEYVEEYVGEDVEITALVVPPIPREKMPDYEDQMEDDVKDHMYDLTDLALSINHTGDVIQSSGLSEKTYASTEETVAEGKVAHGALLSCYNRELRAVANRIGIDDSSVEDYVQAIRNHFGYGRTISVEEDVVQLDELNSTSDS